jgi:MFS family permease
MRKLTEKQVKESLDYSVKDGCAWSAMNSFSDPFVIPFGRALGATPMQIGLLRGLPFLASGFTQPLAALWSSSREFKKNLVVVTGVGQALSLFLIALVPFLFPGNPIPWLILFWTLSITFLRFGIPSWFEWMHGLLGGNSSHYLAKRTAVTSLVGFVSLLTSGFLLSAGTNALGDLTAFSLLFLAAACFRGLSSFFLSKKGENPSKTHSIDFRKFFSGIHKSDFVNKILFFEAIIFCFQFAAPFLTLWQLGELGWSKNGYVKFTIALVTFSLVYTLSQKYWGNKVKEKGSWETAKKASLMIAVFPIPWLLTENFVFLIAWVGFTAFAFGGFDLSVTNFMVAHSPKKHKQAFLSFQQLVDSMAWFLAPLLGGLLAEVVKDSSFYWLKGYQILFLLQAMLFAGVMIFAAQGERKENRVPA